MRGQCARYPARSESHTCFFCSDYRRGTRTEPKKGATNKDSAIDTVGLALLMGAAFIARSASRGLA